MTAPLKCEVSQGILVYAVRYSLGRYTAAPRETAVTVLANEQRITDPGVRKAMISDIREWLAKDKSRDAMTHDPSTIEMWQRALRALESRAAG